MALLDIKLRSDQGGGEVLAPQIQPDMVVFMRRVKTQTDVYMVHGDSFTVSNADSANIAAAITASEWVGLLDDSLQHVADVLFNLRQIIMIEPRKGAREVRVVGLEKPVLISIGDADAIAAAVPTLAKG